MRVIPPPVTDREISTMMVGTLEKKVGEIEARLRRRPSALYTARDRRRDVAALVRVHETIAEHQAFLDALDAAERAAARRAA